MQNRYDSNRISVDAYKRVDNYIDNFTYIQDVKTELLYGQKSESVPFITIIVPTYKRVALLKEALLSIINQQEVNFFWECIVIDNTELDDANSTPALKLVKELNSDRILYYHNSVNIGSGYNWNRAVELARSKWIAFLHDDDVLCRDALKNIYDIINASYNFRKPLGYIHARNKCFEDFFDEGKIKIKKLPFHLELTRFTTLILGHTHTGMPTCGTTILREAYIKAGGINYDFGPTADAVLGYLIMKNYTVLRSGVVLGGYRWSNNETLKVSTIEQLIKSDYYFAKYRYNLNQLSKLWGILFIDAQLQDNINTKVMLLKQHSNTENIRFSKFVTNKHSNIIQLYLLKLVKCICKLAMAIKGILVYRY